MTSQIIQAEADSLEEAKEKIRSQIPAGLQLLWEDVISDGKLIIKSKQILEVEAESLEEARGKIKSELPEGIQMLRENIISDGMPKTLRVNADAIEEAFVQAQKSIPANATILEKKTLTTPERRVITVESFDDESAYSSTRVEVRNRFGNTATVKRLSLVTAGRKGFLGLGKKPGQYEAEILVQQATIEVLYKPKAKIVAEVGVAYRPKAKISATIGEKRNAEEIMAALQQNPAGNPLCWVVCYEARPLQGAPPGSTEPLRPYLLIFTSSAKANAFIAGRRRFYAPEPLSVVGIDTPVTLKELGNAPANDPDYEQPPCGVLLDFRYPNGAIDAMLTPDQVAEVNADQLIQGLGLKT